MKALLFLFVLPSLLSLAACTSVTKPTQNTGQQVNTVSPVQQQNQQRVLKRKVAIARFSDETKRSNSFLIDDEGSKLGKQASDILAARLVESGKFIMLERIDLEKVIQEQGFGQLAAMNVGADYLIIGSVSEFGRGNQSEVGVFSRNRIQKADATVNIRMVNTQSGEIVFSQEGKGSATIEANTVFGVGDTAGYDASLDDKAISAAISKVISNLMENLLEKPWQAFLIKDDDGQLYLSAGASQGIKVGDEFKVLLRGKTMVNPQTGLPLEMPGKQVANIRVNALMGSGNNELSLVNITSGSLAGMTIDKLVVRE